MVWHSTVNEIRYTQAGTEGGGSNLRILDLRPPVDCDASLLTRYSKGDRRISYRESICFLRRYSSGHFQPQPIAGASSISTRNNRRRYKQKERRDNSNSHNVMCELTPPPTLTKTACRAVIGFFIFAFTFVLATAGCLPLADFVGALSSSDDASSPSSLEPDEC